MKKLFYLIIFFFIANCSNNKVVYWCGDHQCINKVERESYFKKSMTVEIRELKSKSIEVISEIEKINKKIESNQKKSKVEKKNLAKQIKIEEKRRIQEEKDLAKQIKIEEKRRIQEEKDLAKQIKIEEKRRTQEEKDLAKQIKIEEKRQIQEEKKLKKKIESSKKSEKKMTKKISQSSINTETPIKFNELFKKITKRNSFRPYPDINDIPN